MFFFKLTFFICLIFFFYECYLYILLFGYCPEFMFNLGCLLFVIFLFLIIVK